MTKNDLRISIPDKQEYLPSFMASIAPSKGTIYESGFSPIDFNLREAGHL
jgi:hypothetical protein